jgi:hypothetical protein
LIESSLVVLIMCSSNVSTVDIASIFWCLDPQKYSSGFQKIIVVGFKK